MNQPTTQKSKLHPFLSLLLFLSPFFILHSLFLPPFSPLPTLAQTTPNHTAEADRLIQQGIQQLDTSQYRAALQSFQRALEIYRAIGNRNGEAAALNNLGIVYYSLSEYQKAIEYYQQALPMYRQVGDLSGEAFALNNLGNAYSFLSQYQKAIEYYQQVLPTFRQMGDRNGESSALNNLGRAYHSLSEYQKAIEYYQQSLLIAQQTGNRIGEAQVLTNLGAVYGSLSQHQKAIEYYRQALPTFHQMGDRNGEANVLTNLGATYRSLSQYQQAIEYYQQALPIYRTVGNRNGEADVLTNLGNAYSSLSQYQKAIEYYQQALPIYRTIGNRDGEATALSGLGSIYRSVSQYQQAIKYYQQALSISRSVGDRSGEANALISLGNAYYSLSQYSKVIEFSQQALLISRSVGNRPGEANALISLGNAYYSLSQYNKAIEYYQQALPIFHQVGALGGKSDALINLGNVYNSLSQYNKAIEYYQQALSIFRQIGEQNGEAGALMNIGWAYSYLSQYNKAIEYYQQALPLFRQVGDRNGEADSLTNLAVAYFSLSQYQKAIEYYQQALPMYRQMGNLSGEGLLLTNLGYLLEEQKQPEQAIALYKQSVNVREGIREEIRDLSRQSQESYTQSVSGTYRDLAALLMQQGRLSEAQQVLELLKLRELKDFDRSTQPNPETLKLPLTPAEQSLIAQIQQSPSKALSTTLAQPSVKSNRLNPANPLNRSAQTLLTAQPNAALIYYLVHSDNLWILLVTPDGSLQAISVPVTAQDLAKSVEQFRSLMEQCERRRCGKSDTVAINAVSQTLYRWLFPTQLQQALRSHSTQHLIFALDRMTRYLPVATLHDGQQYLIEQYTVSHIIAAQLTDSRDRLTPKTTSVLGMGFSNPADVPVPSLGSTHRDRFAGLSYVPAELGAIVASNGSRGVYPGLQFLNSTFTLDALRKHLPNHRILHLATHGIFRAESLDASYLLLGTGKPLTIPEIDSNALPSFANVHLIVLSACQTALGGRNQDGVEISGMTNAFLNKGSKAVMSSLWQVDDASTSVLMQQFYKNLATGKLSKSEALKQAQLGLLQGKLTAKDAPNRAEAGVEVKLKPGTQTAARLTDFSHPFYWAPFILIGNGL